MSEHDPSPETVEAWKKDMYERLSKRQRKWVDRLGYEKWDPFQKPFDPIDIRKDVTGRTAQDLAHAFFQSLGEEAPAHYRESVTQFCVELVTNFERVRPTYEFCNFYARLLEKSGKTI